MPAGSSGTVRRGAVQTMAWPTRRQGASGKSVTHLNLGAVVWRMRIAVIAPPWTPVPPPLYGGIELVVDRLARGFQAAGHEVLLFTTGDSTCDVPRAFALEVAEGTRIGAAVP